MKKPIQILSIEEVREVREAAEAMYSNTRKPVILDMGAIVRMCDSYELLRKKLNDAYNEIENNDLDNLDG